MPLKMSLPAPEKSNPRESDPYELALSKGTVAGGIRLESSKELHLPPRIDTKEREGKKKIDDLTRPGVRYSTWNGCRGFSATATRERERERERQGWWQGVGGASAALGVLVKCASAVPRSVQAGGWSPFRDVYGCVVAKWLCAIA